MARGKLLLVLFISLIFVGTASADGFITNGDFETCTLTGWSTYVSSGNNDIYVGDEFSEYEGNYHLQIESYSDIYTQKAHVAQTVNLTNRNYLTYQWDAHINSEKFGTFGKGDLNIIVDGTTVATHSPSRFNFYQDRKTEIVDISSYSGDCEIGIQTHAEADETIYAYVDNIKVQNAGLILVEPSKNVTINASYPPFLHDIRLGWVPSINLTNTFRYQVAEDSSFNQMVEDDYTSNTEATVTLAGGTYYWRVYPYDTETETTGTVSDTYSFTIESTQLQIYDVTTMDLIDDRNIDVSFYEQGPDSSAMITNTTDGNVTLDYIPETEDSEYVIVAKADGYIARNAILDEYANMYLIPNTTVSNELVIQITDHTSLYPSTTTKLFIEKAIPINGESAWRQVSGDYVGADQQYSDFLVDGDRYRFRLVSQDGDTRVVGQYNSLSPEAINLIVGDLSWDIQKEPGYNTQVTYEDTTDEGEVPNGIIRFQYADAEDLTTFIDIEVYEKNNESNIIYTANNSGTMGEYVVQVPIVGEENTSKSWIVDYDITRSGETNSYTDTIAPPGGYLDFPGDDEQIITILLALLLLFFALMFGGNFASMGAVILCAMAAILWFMGWQLVPISVIIVAGVVSVLFLISDREGGI